MSNGCVVDGDCNPKQTCNTTMATTPYAICEAAYICGESQYTTYLIPANVMILLDRTMQMAGSAGGDSRWNVATNAISAITARYDTTIDFGLATYSSCMPGGCSPGSIAASVDNTNAGLIGWLLDQTVDQGSHDGKGTTSSGKVLYLCDSGSPEASIGKSLEALVDTGSNDVILLTAGAESAECKGACDGPCGAQKLLLQIPPVKTHVIGLGVDPAAIDPIAASGGTGKSIGANDQAELNSALDQIVASTVTCVYSVGFDYHGARTSDFFVYFDDDPTGVPRDDTNGWSYDPATYLLSLHGSACDQAKAAADMDVVSCPGPVPD